MSDDCVFCQIAAGKVPAKKVYEDEQFVGVLDINPAAPGHVLVMPKQHIAVMPQMSDELVVRMSVVARSLSQAMLTKLEVEGVSVFVGNGAVAGQRAPHVMMHVIPRKEGDGIALDITRRDISQEQVHEAVKKLGPAFQKYFLGKQEPAGHASQLPEQGPPKEGNPELDDVAEFLTK